MRPAYTYLVVQSLLLVAASKAPAQCDPKGFWNPSVSLPGPRYEGIAISVGDTIYHFGDYSYSDNNGDVFAFRPGVDVGWMSKTAMPAGRGQFAAAAVGTKVFLFGGNRCFSNCWLTETACYDTETDTWTDGLAPIPSALTTPYTPDRGWLSAVEVDGLIYVMGGVDSYEVPTYSDNLIYDPATDMWSGGSPLPRPRAHHGAVELHGKIYLVGGQYRLQHDDSIAVPEVDVYDPVTDMWSLAAPLPTPRGLLSVVVLNGRIYAIGGITIDSNGEWDAPTASVEEYDPVLDCWRDVTALPGSRDTGTATVHKGLMYYIGGQEPTEGNPTDASDDVFVGYPLPLPSPTFGDLNGDEMVDETDLQIMYVLVGFDTCDKADLNGDSVVNVLDLLIMLGQWGPCG